MQTPCASWQFAPAPNQVAVSGRPDVPLEGGPEIMLADVHSSTTTGPWVIFRSRTTSPPGEEPAPPDRTGSPAVSAALSVALSAAASAAGSSQPRARAARTAS